MVKKWTWGKNSIGKSKITNHWTLLAVECYIRGNCNNCVYWRYCRQNVEDGIPIMKKIANELASKFGEPTEELIDKVWSRDYN